MYVLMNKPPRKGSEMLRSTLVQAGLHRERAPREAAEQEVKRHGENVRVSCERAIEHLERYAAAARQELADALAGGDLEMLELPGRLLTKSAWGTANAANELQRAMKFSGSYSAALEKLDALSSAR